MHINAVDKNQTKYLIDLNDVKNVQHAFHLSCSLQGEKILNHRTFKKM